MPWDMRFCVHMCDSVPENKLIEEYSLQAFCKTVTEAMLINYNNHQSWCPPISYANSIHGEKISLTVKKSGH